MPGQVATGINTFEITELQVVETGGGELNNIVDQNEQFRLKAHVVGSGTNWTNYKNTGCKVRARFYADGMGPNVTDHDFGVVFAPMQDDFWIETALISVNQEGIFRCGVVANLFDSTQAIAMTGYVAYNENCPLQVNPHEE